VKGQYTKKIRDKLGYKVFIRHDYGTEKLNNLLENDAVKLLGKNFVVVDCLRCNEKFLAQNKGTGAKYCSAKCRVDASRERVLNRAVEEEIARRKEQGLL
jgi:hypothetical protein|tara:strand:- start:314 stop:613 length:300 start_codon:yes stop_codon:yes gene_type:complete